jgi:hypothetical protein
MKINYVYKNRIEYLLVDDFYSQQELEEIKQELLDIKRFASSPAKTKSALYENKLPKKHGNGVFLDDLYRDQREISSILTYNRKLFCNEFASECEKFSPNFKHISACNEDYTLVNYYGNNNFYDSHTDRSVLTAISFFKIGKFDGGEFCLPEMNEVIPFKENSLIIFAGCIDHKANPIQAQDGNYRVSIAQFLNYTGD